MRSALRGSMWSFEGGVMLSFSIGLAVHTFWSDLEKCLKSARPDSGGLGSTFWPGDFSVANSGSRKIWFCDEIALR